MNNNMKILRRKSAQREKILELIKCDPNHPTAQRIYDTLKKEIPSLSLGNVYRNINILVEEGVIVSRDFGDGIEHFDAITGMHYHFICDKCKTITDFALPVEDLIIKKAREKSGHTITGHTIQFYGVCENCSR
jgi:Fur family peroxide stress response transcriptional regulator